MQWKDSKDTDTILSDWVKMSDFRKKISDVIYINYTTLKCDIANTSMWTPFIFRW